MKNDSEKPDSDQSPKLRRSKSRDVSSRFLSPTSTERRSQSPNQALSPVGRKSGSATDVRKHRSLGDIGIIRGLWPSSTSSSSRSSKSSSKKLGTLANHLGNNRLKDLVERGKNDRSAVNNSPQLLSRQSSCSEFNRFEKEKKKENSKENHRPTIGGSMRYTGELQNPAKSSSNNSFILPGRLSVDENKLNRRSSLHKSDSFGQSLESDSDCSDTLSGTDFSSPASRRNPSLSSSTSSLSYLSSTASSRRSGMELSSRFLHDPSTKLRRATSDSRMPTPAMSDDSPKSINLPPKSAIKGANSLTATSQWELAPGRSRSPPVSAKKKGKPYSFSSLKPPNSPPRGKGVGNFLSLGLDLFKSKKSPSSCLSPVGPGIADAAHRIRLLHNRLIQWRYVNAKAGDIQQNKTTQAENNLLITWASISKLQSSVVQKRIQVEKEKLDLRVNTILHSQVKPLEAWGELERPHLLAVSNIKDRLHTVVCRVPLIEGAKVDPHSASVAVRHAADLVASTKTMLTNYSPMAEKTSSLLSELAEMASREKSLIEECFELLGMVSDLEMQERSLKCNIIQLKSLQQQQQQQQQDLVT